MNGLDKDIIGRSFEEYQEYKAFLESQDLPLPSLQLCRPYISAFPVLNDEDAEEEDRLCFEEGGMEWQFIFYNPTEGMLTDFVTNEVADCWHVTAKNLVSIVHENLKASLPYIGYHLLFGQAAENVRIPFLEISYMYNAGYHPSGASLILSKDVEKQCCKMLGHCVPFIVDQESLWVLPTECLRRNRIDPRDACVAILKNDPSRMVQFYDMKKFFPEIADPGLSDM